jgi:flagellar hook protein FlgE
MQDAFITAINSEKSALGWFEMLTKNMSNIYTPGFREIRGSFHTFMDSSDLNELGHKQDQTKSIPGVAPENLFLEGKGFFTVRKPDGSLLYTRLGDFKFNGKGDYVTKDGYKVQGYILDKSGNIMNQGSAGPDPNNPSMPAGGPGDMATTDISMWMDPANGKYLGKYDEWKIEGNGIVYGKNKEGKVKDPLFKIAIVNFHNPESLTMPEVNFFSQNEASGAPVASTAETRSGLLEKSNVDFRQNIHLLQQAKLQLSVTNKIISTNKTLLEEALRLIQ